MLSAKLFPWKIPIRNMPPNAVMDLTDSEPEKIEDKAHTTKGPLKRPAASPAISKASPKDPPSAKLQKQPSVIQEVEAPSIKRPACSSSSVPYDLPGDQEHCSPSRQECSSLPEARQSWLQIARNRESEDNQHQDAQDQPETPTEEPPAKKHQKKDVQRSRPRNIPS